MEPFVWVCDRCYFSVESGSRDLVQQDAKDHAEGHQKDDASDDAYYADETIPY